MDKDIRWVQRFNNYKKVIQRLGEAIDQHKHKKMSDLEKEGTIQRFEYTFELAWKTLQDILYYQGYLDIKGPNPVLKQALLDGYINNEEAWRKMKEARELTSHTYDEDTANEIIANIIKSYYDLLNELKTSLDREVLKLK